MNGVEGVLLSLIFRNEPQFREKLDPVLKVGFVHTIEEQGFEVQAPTRLKLPSLKQH